jgi:hypothetical protein
MRKKYETSWSKEPFFSAGKIAKRTLVFVND